MTPRRTALTAALLAAALVLPGQVADAEPAPTVTAADLPRLTAELAEVTARAQELTEALELAARRDGGLRVALEDLEQARDDAQARLDARARQVYMARASRPDPLASLRRSLTAPGLERLASAGTQAAVRVEQELVDAVAQESAEVRALRQRAERFRAGLRRQATEVLAAQDRARSLLAVAQQLAVERQAREELARIEAARRALDEVSATVTLALTPAQTRRSRGAQVREAPLVALAEAAGSGYPEGFVPTGEVLRGEASWYGPGFVGNPTASGSPYDPERLTCAHKTLPLGTLVRVQANGRQVSCLVNDRGPYAGDRILDMSRAGSRSLGYDGVAQVVVEVLAPTG